MKGAKKFINAPGIILTGVVKSQNKDEQSGGKNHQNSDDDIAQNYSTSSHFTEINQEIDEEIFKKICKLMDAAPQFKPATLHGKNVVSNYECTNFENIFTVKSHKITDDFAPPPVPPLPEDSNPNNKYIQIK